MNDEQRQINNLIALNGNLQWRITQLRKDADEEKLSIDDLLIKYYDERRTRNECYKANKALRDKVVELQRQLSEAQNA